MAKTYRGMNIQEFLAEAGEHKLAAYLTYPSGISYACTCGHIGSRRTPTREGARQKHARHNQKETS